jgi:predicted DNA-binding transcriptional regulator AlpA
MTESLIQDIEKACADKPLLSIEDIAHLVGCSTKVVYNWTRRNDPAKRPPKLVVGRTLRFPRTEFIRWLVREQGRA